MGARISIDLSDLSGSLKKVTRALDAATRPTLQHVGLFMEGEMKQAAPYLTGRLRSSIGNEMLSDDEVEIGVVKPRDGRVLIYAPVQEFGNRAGTIKGKRFIFGTFERHESKAVEFIREKLEEALKDV